MPARETPAAAPAPIDLRSDTLTRPTPAMREAMARAEVGDDVYGEDPTCNQMEERVAALLGKAAAVFMPSGSMANQIALLLHCRPGDDVIVGDGAHNMLYEVGGGGALAGVQFTVAGKDGLYTPAELIEAVKPPAFYYPRTRLACVENTHNRSGGRVWPLPMVDAVCAAGRAHGLALHLDGARLWNAAAATGESPARLAAGFDTISVCLSKGLGAPIGSLLVGSVALMQEARRLRKRLGGGMRQAGILAAAGLYALDHHLGRLAEDHAHARAIARALAAVPTVQVIPPESNIVCIDLQPGIAADAEAVCQRAAKAGVRIGAMGPRRVRAVTHLDASADDCARAATLLAEVLGGLS